MPWSVARPRSSATRIAQACSVAVLLILLMGAGDDARFDRLGHKMICACGCRQILLECNHVGCQYSDRMRGELSTWLARGDSDDLVLQAFMQKYGQTVLAAPTTSGFNRVAWITPFAVFLAGIALAVFVVLGWRSLPQAAAAGSTGVQPLESYRQQARKETAEL